MWPVSEQPADLIQVILFTLNDPIFILKLLVTHKQAGDPIIIHGHGTMWYMNHFMAKSVTASLTICLDQKSKKTSNKPKSIFPFQEKS